MKTIFIQPNQDNARDYKFYLNYEPLRCSVPVRIQLSSDWKTHVYDTVWDAIASLSGRNACQNGVRVALVNSSPDKEKVLITASPGDIVFIPSGIDLTLDELFIHLKDGSVRGIDYEILPIGWSSKIHR